MLSSYRRVLAHPGALAFSMAGLVARLPISMAGLAIVLLVSAETGSYGRAGAVSAAYMVANAVLAVVQGRLVDTVGQARVLSAAAGVFGAAMALLAWSVEAGWPSATAYVFAALAGGSLPQVGSCVRARWAHVLSQPEEVQTAYALEAVLDEVVFVLGPIVVTVLATTVHPVLGLGVGVVAGVGGSLAFSAQRGTEPPPHPRRGASGPRAAMPWTTVVVLAVVSAALGVLFGGVEVASVAFAEEQGRPAFAGALLAALALGSMVAGLVTGAIAWRRGPASRTRWGALGMTLAMVPPYFVDSLAALAGFLLLGGLAIAPTMVATLSLTVQVVPVSRVTEGMAIVQTGLVAGIAPGATISGFVVDHHGGGPAYLVCAAGGAVAVLAAQLLPRGRATSARQPGTPGDLADPPPPTPPTT